MGYLTNFIVYTLAMVGVIVVALLVFKNATSLGNGNKAKNLKIIDSLSLGPRKTLYVISTGKEKFLIAGDTERTSLISKLENFDEETINLTTKTFDNNKNETLKDKFLNFNQKNTNFDSLKDNYSSFSNKGIGIKSLAERIK